MFEVKVIFSDGSEQVFSNVIKTTGTEKELVLIIKVYGGPWVDFKVKKAIKFSNIKKWERV